MVVDFIWLGAVKEEPPIAQVTAGFLSYGDYPVLRLLPRESLLACDFQQ